MTLKPYITRTKILFAARDAGMTVETVGSMITITGPVTLVMNDAGLTIDAKPVTAEQAYASLGFTA